MTRTWALELARDGITVNTVAPGPIATEMFYNNFPSDSPATKAFLEAIPVGRIGTPADVAAALNFLLSDDAGFITGRWWLPIQEHARHMRITSKGSNFLNCCRASALRAQSPPTASHPESPRP
jgi:short-subunit dehydrogenase